tara:strand:- start:38276 stop:38479 length:204 start_codon:yes stop_codon:yes gene_type:complete
LHIKMPHPQNPARCLAHECKRARSVAPPQPAHPQIFAQCDPRGHQFVIAKGLQRPPLAPDAAQKQAF